MNILVKTYTIKKIYVIIKRYPAMALLPVLSQFKPKLTFSDFIFITSIIIIDIIGKTNKIKLTYGKPLKAKENIKGSIK
nr:hypothetical protein [Ruminococcus bromii]